MENNQKEELDIIASLYCIKNIVEDIDRLIGKKGGSSIISEEISRKLFQIYKISDVIVTKLKAK